MSEQSERLFEAISDLKDETVDPALEPPKKRRHRRWMGWAAMAACLCLVVGIITGRIPLRGKRNYHRPAGHHPGLCTLGAGVGRGTGTGAV